MKIQTLWEELTELVGPGFAATLQKEFGGDFIYVPALAGKECSAARALIELLGDKLAASVRREFRGLRVYVPSASHAEMKERKAQRDRAIVAMKKAGASNRDIIRAHGISIRSIQSIVAAQERTS